MDFSEVNIAPGNPDILRKQVAGLAGFSADDVPEPYAGIIETETEYAQRNGTVKAGFGILSNLEINPEYGSFRLGGVTFKTGRKIAGYLSGSEKLILYVCTAGEAITKRTSAMNDGGNTLEAYIADLAGTVTLENAMDRLHQQLVVDMRRDGLEVTNRYSPGYWSWDVREQHLLFDFFPPGFCGVRLSDSGMMIPVKTVSGVIGVGKDAVFHEYSCDECNSVRCIYRNKKNRQIPKFTCSGIAS